MCSWGCGVCLLLLFSGNHTKIMASTIVIQGNTLDLTMQITYLGKDYLLFPTGRIQNSYTIAVHLSMGKGNKQSKLKFK